MRGKHKTKGVQMSTVMKEQPKMSSQSDSNPPTHEDDPILTISEVGRQLGKSPQTIARWCRDGLLAAVRLPSSLFGIRKSEVNKFLGGSAIEKRVE
jgi:excisionase family DNA binding protein